MADLRQRRCSRTFPLWGSLSITLYTTCCVFSLPSYSLLGAPSPRHLPLSLLTHYHFTPLSSPRQALPPSPPPNPTVSPSPFLPSPLPSLPLRSLWPITKSTPSQTFVSFHLYCYQPLFSLFLLLSFLITTLMTYRQTAQQFPCP